MADIAQHLSGLHLIVLWICAVVAAAVFAMLLYSIATFRFPPAPAQRTRTATAEFLWAIVPILIVIGMAAPAVVAQLAVGEIPDPRVEIAFRTEPPPGPEVALENSRRPFQDGLSPL